MLARADRPLPKKLRKKHRVFARNGWRCTVPGRLRFALGLRQGQLPLVSYASGDLVLGDFASGALGGLAMVLPP